MICIESLEQQAKSILSQVHYDYFAGGAESESTARANIEAIEKIKLWPRMLRGKYSDTLQTDILGCQMSGPVIVAPTAFHRLAHADGETATARAVAANNGLMIVSMASTTPMEEIAAAARKINSDVNLWFQLYLQPDAEFNRYLLDRITTAGFKGIVVTIDSPVFGKRYRDLHNGFNELPAGLNCPNMEDGKGNLRNIEFDASLTWEGVNWLCEQSSLPVAVKGLMHPGDVDYAVQSGARAIILSNHGGRQLDGAPATIDVLPAVAESVARRVPLIVDGGFRRGSDILKALALGADAVALGRPIIWALAVNGEQGVVDLLSTIDTELQAALLLCGCRNKQDINRELLFINQ